MIVLVEDRQTGNNHKTRYSYIYTYIYKPTHYNENPMYNNFYYDDFNIYFKTLIYYA